MASSLKFVCFFFLLTTLLFSLQTYARDSHFFSKVSRNRDTVTTPNTNNNNLNTKENAFEPLNKQEEQQEQPTFIPQTTETGYGLYGHETGLDPPSTTTSKTSLYNMGENNNNNNNYENFNDNFYKNNNENHEKNYVPELKGLSSTSYTNEPNKYINNNNYNNNNYNNNNKYNNNDEGKFYGVGYNGMGEKQGMSDTRFLENGKYFHDLNNERKYDSNNNNYMSYSNKYDNNYNTNEYYGNKENNFEEFYNNNNYNNNKYKYNNNKFYNGNGMKGYQNQETEEEFDFDQP